MSSFLFNNKKVTYLTKDQTVLSALEEAGFYVPSDCLSGRCNFCLLKIESGVINENSQYNLSKTQVNKGLFKSCVASVDPTIICNDKIYD